MGRYQLIGLRVLNLKGLMRTGIAVFEDVGFFIDISIRQCHRKQIELIWF